MRTFGANFTSRKNAASSTPYLLAVFHFPAGDVYVSGRAVTPPGGPAFSGIVTSWGTLSSRATGLFKVSLPEVSVELANTGSPAFLTYLDGGGADSAEAELYLWFDGLAYAEKEPLGKFVVSSPVSYSEDAVRLALVSALVKRNKVIGRAISRDDYPYADPEAIGRIENIIYGAPKNVPCLPVIAGACTTLVSDITATQTTGIALTMGPNEIAFPSSGTLQVGAEKIGYTGISNKTLTGVTRAASGTVAAAHKKGSQAFEVRTDFTYLVAGHPVKSIGDVYVGGVRVASGVTKLTNDNGKAKVVLSSRFTVEKAVSLAISESGHSHQLDEQQVSLFGGIGQIGYGLPALYSSVPSNTATLGPITGITVKVTLVDTDPTYNMHCTVVDNSYDWTLNSGTLELVSGRTMTFVLSASSISDPDMDWSDELEVKIDDTDGRAATVQSVEFVVRYQAASAASSAGAALSGNSTADVSVGGIVTCDVDGYADDSSGTYTGTPNALIENPADVLHHFLLQQMGVPSGEITSSFTTARQSLASLSYKFAGVMDRPVDALDMLEDLCAQSRLALSHDGYAASLKLVSNTPASADKTILKACIKEGSFTIARTGREEVINRLDIRCLRDWPKRGAFLALADRSASYPKDGDSASVAAYGPRARAYDYAFVADAGMASSLRDFHIARFKDVKRRVFLTTFLDCLELQEGDVIALDFPSSAFDLSGEKFFVEKVSLAPGSHTRRRLDEVTIQAREL